MKTKLFTYVGAGVLAGTIALGGLGFAAAQGPATGPGPGGGPPAGVSRQHENGPSGPQFGGNARARQGGRYAEVQAAIAGALGMTVEELQAARAEGKTVAVLAQERGIDLATIQAAVQAGRPGLGRNAAAAGEHQPGGGPYGHRGAGNGAGGDCPFDGN